MLILRKDSKLHLTRKLKNLFSHQFDAAIWRIEPDVANQQLGLELRDADSLEVSFGLIDLNKNQVVWDELSFESGWWTGLNGLQGGFMLFYTYEDQQNPEQKNTFALSTADKEVCWAYEGYNHLAFLEESSVGFSMDEEDRHYSQISLKSGELSSLSDEEGLRLLNEAKLTGEAGDAEITFPVQYEAESPYFATVQSFIKEHINAEAIAGCEYLEIFDKIIISYYTANREMLSNAILVCNGQAEILLHEQINNAGGGVAFDTFFVSGKKLIFTKEKRTIECYEIY